DVAEFRVRSEQLSSRDRRLIKAAPARRDNAGEGVCNRSKQGTSHRKIPRIQLIEVQAARQRVHTVVPYVGDVNDIVGRSRVLKSIHPLLVIVRLAFWIDGASAESNIGQRPQRISRDRYRTVGKRVAKRKPCA